MTTCSSSSSLRSLFEKPLPENPTLLESLSAWNQINPTKPIEIFGELYFQDPNTTSSSTPSPPPVQMRENLSFDSLLGLSATRYRSDPKSESLQLCTEGLGSESSDDIDDMMEEGHEWRSRGIGRRQPINGGPTTRSAKEFPPPISSIGKSGRPVVCLRSYREDGRFVLKEIRIPCHELLRASREDGRLKLRFVGPDENVSVRGDDEEEEEEEDCDEDMEQGKVGES